MFQTICDLIPWDADASPRARRLELMRRVADNLRVSYGEGGLLQVLRLILRAGQVYPLQAEGRLLGDLDPAAPLRLVWPPWYPATSEDQARDAATILSLVQGGLLGRKAARRLLAADWNGADLDEEENT
jgi:hypothetical protein